MADVPFGRAKEFNNFVNYPRELKSWKYEYDNH